MPYALCPMRFALSIVNRTAVHRSPLSVVRSPTAFLPRASSKLKGESSKEKT